MKKRVRHASLSLRYNSIDISADAAPFLTSFDYNDVMDGKCTDDISVTFEDKDGNWLNNWFPEHGATMEATLHCHDWPGGKVLQCGSFEIDDIQFSGPPHTCTISAVAIGVHSRLRREVHTRTWENLTVREIAQEIASANDFELVFDSSVDPKLDRHDQREISDMEMLVELCANAGLGIKTSENKMLIYEKKLYDQRAPSLLFRRGEGGYINHNFRLPTTDIYSACRVRYLDPRSRMLIAHLYTPPASEWSGKRPPGRKTLELNERCACEADAERMAKAALRKANEKEVNGSISYLGTSEYLAGEVAAIDGWGRLDAAKYFVENVRHHYSKSDGYTTAVELRGRLEH